MKYSMSVSIAVILVSFSARADVKVIYFGGATAKKSVLNQCFPDFENYGYPASSAAQNNVVNEINAHPNQQYIIAGHSSGALFADNVAKAKLLNPSRITLVDLDGYAPRNVPSAIKRVCVRAASTSHPGLHSRNYDSMNKSNNCEYVFTHSDAHCSSKNPKDMAWCLHFSIVNPQTPSGLGSGNWSSQGYKGCSEANLDWLNSTLKIGKPATGFIESQADEAQRE